MMRKPRSTGNHNLRQVASVRFDDVLAAGEREAVTRSLGSAGATLTSWNVAADRTYALAASARALPSDAFAELLRHAVPDASSNVPPHAVLRVTPDRPRLLAGLAAALGGPGRPAGVVACAVDDGALVLEIDVRTTPLSFVLTLIDVELTAVPGTSSGRRIEPILPLTDEMLADVAAAILGEPHLDASRVIETYLEPLLAGEAS